MEEYGREYYILNGPISQCSELSETTYCVAKISTTANLNRYHFYNCRS